MNNRVIIPVLVASALVYACGPRTHQSEATANPTTPRARRAQSADVLASQLDIRLGEQATFVLRVTNTGDKKIELTFPSGQTHDFAVLDSSGVEVWRWSEGRMFTQALQTKVLDGEGTATYDAEWSPDGRHGRHTVVARLTSVNHPVETRAEFVLP